MGTRHLSETGREVWSTHATLKKFWVWLSLKLYPRDNMLRNDIHIISPINNDLTHLRNMLVCFQSSFSVGVKRMHLIIHRRWSSYSNPWTLSSSSDSIWSTIPATWLTFPSIGFISSRSMIKVLWGQRESICPRWWQWWHSMLESPWGELLNEIHQPLLALTLVVELLLPLEMLGPKRKILEDLLIEANWVEHSPFKKLVSSR